MKWGPLDHSAVGNLDASWAAVRAEFMWMCAAKVQYKERSTYFKDSCVRDWERIVEEVGL